MSQKKTILIVDDEPRYVRLVEINLQTEGYQVRTASNGQEAVEAVAADQPDLILLDVMMPDMDGPATLRRLRELPHLMSTPVIFMTAKVRASEVGEYQAMGALGVIAKPFDPMTLADQIRDILKTKHD